MNPPASDPSSRVPRAPHSRSGVVYSAEGLILTNEHVVRGRTDVEVAFADGRRVAGIVRATDAVSDLALV